MSPARRILAPGVTCRGTNNYRRCAAVDPRRPMSLDRDHEASDARQDDGALPASAASRKGREASADHAGTTAVAGKTSENGAGMASENGVRTATATAVRNGGAPDGPGAAHSLAGGAVDNLLSDL